MQQLFKTAVTPSSTDITSILDGDGILTPISELDDNQVIPNTEAAEGPSLESLTGSFTGVTVDTEGFDLPAMRTPEEAEPCKTPKPLPPNIVKHGNNYEVYLLWNNKGEFQGLEILMHYLAQADSRCTFHIHINGGYCNPWERRMLLGAVEFSRAKVITYITDANSLEDYLLWSLGDEMHIAPGAYVFCESNGFAHGKSGDVVEGASTVFNMNALLFNSLLEAKILTTGEVTTIHDEKKTIAVGHVDLAERTGASIM